jgi:hypothetical protein
MKTSTTGPGGTFRIVSPDRGKTWTVTDAQGSAVWTGTSFREARSQHTARVLRIDIKTARRMGN